MKYAALFSALAIIAGCKTACPKQEPLDVRIAPECRGSCFTGADIGVDLATLLQSCDARRQLCVEALDRAEQAKAIK